MVTAHRLDSKAPALTAVRDILAARASAEWLAAFDGVDACVTLVKSIGEAAQAVLARNGGYRLAGYAEVARRWMLTPRDHPRHPGWSGCGLNRLPPA